jgi:two-component system, chemotaxis family, response regulator Rcp1
MPTATGDDLVEILLVEDNPGDAILTRKVLEEITSLVNITVATDGERAMSMLRAEREGERVRPDLILLDINLPRMSGHEVLAELKRDERLRRIPVVALTSSSADADINAAYDNRINAYMIKCVDLQAFIDGMRCMHDFWFGTAKMPPRP